MSLKKAFYYEIVDEDESKIELFTEEGDSLGVKSIDYKDKEYIVGIICSMVAKGENLSVYATGLDWRPTVQQFHIWLEKNSKFQQMYYRAKKLRVKMLEENIITRKEGVDTKRQIDVLKHLKTQLKEEKSEKDELEEKEYQSLHVNWSDVDSYFKRRKKVDKKDSESAWSEIS